MPAERHPAAAKRKGLKAIPRATGASHETREPARGDGPMSLRKDSIELHNGHRVAYRTGGWGPLLVLIHGITSNSATWDRVLPSLAERYTVLAVDLLGHGRSDKPRWDYSLGAHANTVRDLLDALSCQRAMVVGHSLGGGVAAQFAYQYPERVDRLVLVAPGGFGREVSAMFRAASLPGAGGLLALAAWRPLVEAGTALTQYLGRLGFHGGTDLEEIGRGYAMLADPAARSAFLHTLRAVVDWRGQRVSALDHLVTARIPSLLVWGERDRLVPADHGRAVHQAGPGTELAVFPGAGHFPQRDDPPAFVRVVDEFLARSAQPRRLPAALSA